MEQWDVLFKSLKQGKINKSAYFLRAGLTALLYCDVSWFNERCRRRFRDIYVQFSSYDT